MRIFLSAAALMCSVAVYAHTPVCRCELNGNQVTCQGGYHDGSKAVGVTMRVIAYSGEALAAGELDSASRFNTALPEQPFYILMDAGPGEVFEVDWQDIVGMAGDQFAATGAGGASKDGMPGNY